VTLGRPQDVEESLSWGVDMNVVHGFRDGRQTDAYIERVLDDVAADPGSDIFSRIATASLPERDLTRAEKVGLASMVLTAGRAATVNLLAGALWVLASRPDEQARLAADPALVPSAVEEMLRYLSPAPEMDRLVAGRAEGCPADRHVVVSFVSANYDDTIFSKPEVIDLGRSSNPHLAFGAGPHFCLGANLARLEARLLIEEVLRASVRFALDAEPRITWQQVGDLVVPRDFESVPLVAHA